MSPILIDILSDKPEVPSCNNIYSSSQKTIGMVQLTVDLDLSQKQLLGMATQWQYSESDFGSGTKKWLLFNLFSLEIYVN